jgi:alpha-mannosidase
MRISAVTSTLLFRGSAARPRQIVQVTVVNDTAAQAGPATVTVAGRGIATPEPAAVPPLPPGGEHVAQVAVEAPGLSPGAARPVTVIAQGGAGRAEQAAEVTIAEPGWTMWMVSHFHYDPVWWSTQGQFLESRQVLPDASGQLPEVRTAFELVRLHLDAARRDSDYKFVLAEIDYLKPHFDAHPEDRADLLDFIAAGRIELVGGNYNEPNTNLTCAESTIRNAVYGMAYQRDVLAGDPRTAWMLDAFGFDPAYPGLMAAAGLAQSSWARGPFHQWGPGRTAGDNRLMQFAAEFEWLSPDGAGLLTSYMANHYSAGWGTAQADSLAGAERDAYEQFLQLAPVAATRNVLLPVGGDHVIPSRWATAIHRDWNERYLWPRFVTAVPREFFAAVTGDAARGDVWITPQTRDMNPVYTGKDVSFTDTKQAQRQAETALLDGERLATLAWLAGASYPAASLDKAWRLLAFGAHHDAITGTEGDQVYLDLLAGWREAWQRGRDARDAAAGHLAALADTASAGAGGDLAVVVVNTLSAPRSAMTTVTVAPRWPGARWLELRDDAGAPVPFLAEGLTWHPDGTLQAVTLTFRARDVPATGYRTYLAGPADGDSLRAGWRPERGPVIENDRFAVTADPARGGTLSGVTDKRDGAQLLAGPANELILQEEYARHPRWGEGPWLLSPHGPGAGSAAGPARVRAERCPVGARLTTRFELGGLAVTQETLLWDGADRVEFRTHVDGSIGQDKLLRVAFPAAVPGGLPVYQTAVSVIGRPLGPVDTDVARNSFTLDNPAHEWFGVGSTARVALGGGDGGEPELQAIGVAEVITPPVPAAGPGLSRAGVRDLVAALAAQGVTATCSLADGPRYGAIEIDSNLPDFRICLGGPDVSSFAAAVLAAAGPGPERQLAAQLAAAGTARVWVPAARSRADAFADRADVRGPADLPVLIVAGADGAALAAAVQAVTRDLADAVIEVPAPAPPAGPGVAGGPATALAPRSVALLNRGTPSSLVTPEGTATIALMRACSAWPCGIWIDGEPRTAPDGSSFAWQHWSHTFEYALAAGPGDWRAAGFPAAGHDYNTPLLAVVTGRHAGPLPARASLAAVEPPAVVLSALKPRGNPLAPGGAQPRPEDGVTVRLRDAGGGAGPARVTLFTGLTAARGASLLEDAGGDPVPVRDGAAEPVVPAAGVVTLAVTPAAPAWLAGSPAAAAGEPPPEPAQPVYARYWLHGKGPAPAGNLPVAVHLSPPGQSVLPSETGQLVLTVACGPEPARGTVEIDAGAGLDVEPGGPLAYDLPGLGHARWELAVRRRPAPAGGATAAGAAQAAAGGSPADGSPAGGSPTGGSPAGGSPADGGAPASGHQFVTARIADHAGQVIEDAVLVTAGPAAPPGEDAGAAWERGARAITAEAGLDITPRQLELAPGDAGAFEVTLDSHAASGIRGEVQLISPAGSWEFVPEWTAGFAVAAGESVTLSFPVTAPADARPGQRWWVLAKVMYFGRVRYSEAAEVAVK